MKYQGDMANTWTDELRSLVRWASVLLWLSAGSALLLTALSMWLFLFNKGDAHTTASLYFFCILSVGFLVPVLYMVRIACRKAVKQPVFTYPTQARMPSPGEHLHRQARFTP